MVTQMWFNTHEWDGGVIQTNRYIHLVQDVQNIMGTRRRVQEPKCVIREGVLEEAALAWNLRG